MDNVEQPDSNSCLSESEYLQVCTKTYKHLARMQPLIIVNPQANSPNSRSNLGPLDYKPSVLTTTSHVDQHDC